MNALKDLIAPPWASFAIAIVSLVIGIVGTVLTVLYRTKRSLRYRFRHLAFIRKSVSGLTGLEVRFAGYGEPLTNVTVSRVALWNAGRSAIRKTDILGKDHLRIVALGECQILSAEVIGQVNPKNDFDLTRTADRKTANIKFDFVQPGEGAVFQVVHNGIWYNPLGVEGTVADTPITTYKQTKRMKYARCLNAITYKLY
jgi:hypothetical protein